MLVRMDVNGTVRHVLKLEAARNGHLDDCLKMFVKMDVRGYKANEKNGNRWTQK
jgi:pentatricopeptide repeat protein